MCLNPVKPSKCDVFKPEINYLAHHVSQKGVLPLKKNLESIAECPPPDTYTKVKSFVGLVGHYRCFIKGFAKIAVPLYDLTSGDNKNKKSEHIDLSPEALEAFDHLKSACLKAPILAFPFENGCLWERPRSCSVSETGRWVVSSHRLCQPYDERDRAEVSLQQTGIPRP